MKLQGSDTQSIKTLQSENAPQPKSRFPISGLAFLHGRLLPGLAPGVAKKLLAVVQAHWVSRIISTGACRSRKDHAPENFAINILQATLGPARISQKMLQARWNTDFLPSASAHMR